MATKRKPRKANKPAKPSPKMVLGARRPAPAAPIRFAGSVPVPRPAAPRRTRKQHKLATAEAYRITRQSPSGETVIADLMLWCGAFNPIESDDPIKIARAVGRRDVAMHIAQMLGLRDEHFPDEAWKTSALADQLMGMTQ